MKNQLREYKRAVRQFLGTAYTDERLAWLLAHARSEKLAYRSCCCLVGVATAPHPLQGEARMFDSIHPHYLLAKGLAGAQEAERAYCALGYIGNARLSSPREGLRRRRLIPLIRAEMRRRECQRPVSQDEKVKGAGAQAVFKY
jgi:hypothetical protein